MPVGSIYYEKYTSCKCYKAVSFDAIGQKIEKLKKWLVSFSSKETFFELIKAWMIFGGWITSFHCLKQRFCMCTCYICYKHVTRCLLRAFAVTINSNLLFVHSFRQSQLKCASDVIFCSYLNEFLVHSRD